MTSARLRKLVPGVMLSRVADLPTTRTSHWQPILSIRWVHLPYRVPASLPNDRLWCRTIAPACHRLRLLCPRLRTRLTLGRLTLPRNPQACGVSGSHTDCATHSGIRSCVRSTSSRDLASLRRTTLPYHGRALFLAKESTNHPQLRYDA